MISVRGRSPGRGGEVWLVTGGSGFLGRHLLDALTVAAPPDVAVAALGRRPPEGWPVASFLRADVGAPEDLAAALAATRPSVVFHAAGRTPPARPEQYYRINTGGTAHLLAALAAGRRAVRVVVVGSAAELGPVDAVHLPVGEDYRGRAREPYGLSKCLASAVALRARRPLEVMVARVFNPIGPGMPTSQAFGRFAARLAEPGTDSVRLTVGDLAARRDFIDARDVARALIALAGRGRAGRAYHVGTGRSRSVGEGLERLIGLSGRAAIVEPGGGRPSGPRDSRADIRRIVDHTGWRPAIAFEQSLADLWHEARARLPLPPPAPRRIMRPAADGSTRASGDHG